ncbi:NEFA-interacting nuclear protein [Colletotrichum tofieldiae]|uniref:NEFA-interacting nuclear protein n=1 Tax=Colletotrichum tofieldiae TaxID=708197 RepID=A0A166SNR0_9PEZI|nr:NEFA-interacting nuclear protein [Colletotrichum tofieldiae]GKT54587.1 NEFA-interacting nuclear protein [Colletotrichum tofieldiae]GKT76122.1 NEFA-interacting nuclear protein [Colletotrichum tofieldiae]
MSRFVSAGAINAETGEAVVAEETKKGDGAGGAAVGAGAGAAAEPKKNAEWEIVQRELEAERKRREEARIKSVEGGERSLYDVLQANKAAKQAAFEEANKIKNQFRALDDDEIDFLDEVRESKRAEEERVRRETEEGLAAFRRAQNQKRPGDGDGHDDGDDDAAAQGDGDAAAVVPGGAGAQRDGAGAEEEWAVGPRKRRKRERGFGVKRDKSGDGAQGEGAKKTEEKEAGGERPEGGKIAAAQGGEKEKDAVKGSPPAPAKGKPSLVAYGSDSDDD